MSWGECMPLHVSGECHVVFTVCLRGTRTGRIEMSGPRGRAAGRAFVRYATLN